MSNSCTVCKKPASKRCIKCSSVWYCSRECQVADWKVHKKDCKTYAARKTEMEDPTKLIQTLMDNHHITSTDDRATAFNKKVPIYQGNKPSYTVVKIEGKGDGVIANRDIEYGELIMEERPIMKILSHQENENDLRTLFEPLPDSAKSAIMSLHDAYSKNGVKSLLGIKKSNAFAKDENGYLSVIGTVISKFNHSCIQNVDHVFVEPYQRVYAVRNIRKGEELCTAYVSLFERKDERRKKLSDRYGFLCDCSLCTVSDNENNLDIENYRLRYKELENQIKTTPNPNHILPMMKEKYEMMEKGQIMYPRFIRMHAFDCIQLALAFGNYEEANKYVQKGYESILIEEGKKGPRTQEYMKCLAKKIKPELLVQNILAIT